MVVTEMALQRDIARKNQPRGFAGSRDATNPPTNANPMGNTISIRLASSMLWMLSRFRKTSTAVVATTTRIKPARDHARIAARRDVIWPDASARGPREGAAGVGRPAGNLCAGTLPAWRNARAGPL